MANLELLSWWQLILLGAAWIVLVLSVAAALWHRHERLNDGHPGQKRGEVWSKEKRDRERRKLRIIAGACPPHDPVYDETVDETYCSRCLDRMPNE